ncbi:MAG TPA: 3-phosphoshikimate 1-carboxyvinyltransferase [Blastocatellia bacterium]|nr:3-phosphoshikimate 1-carboxyvinyltransferase [Blastocatellia bacterium]
MSRSVRIEGPAQLRGSLRLPGDKSISHRIMMLASIAGGASRIVGLASSADCRATLDCIRRLGVRVEQAGSDVTIHGRGLFGYRPSEPRVHLDAGNSGSTIRMLSGLLAGQHFVSQIDGDASLRKRPMARIIEPLRTMGARVEAENGNFAPLIIHGDELRAIDYVSSVASAQVKTCVLFAGLLAGGRTTFTEPAQSRNHTELMLGELGARIETGPPGTVSLEGRHELEPVDYRVPGDVSSAAFFIAAASVLPGSDLLIEDVNLNPTRTAFIDVLERFGSVVERINVRRQHGEPVGDLVIANRRLTAARTVLSGRMIPNLIDEIPILAVVATQVEGRVEIRDAKELRVKESDRIRTVVDGIRAMGGRIEEFEDGFAVEGPQRLSGGRIETMEDHRIAMAFSVAGLMATGTTEIFDASCVGVSFPGFYEALATLTR